MIAPGASPGKTKMWAARWLSGRVSDMVGSPQGKQNCGKNSHFWTYALIKHRIIRKLLATDRYMLRGIWQALNCLSIHATYCVIIAGVSPGERKMWAAVRENFDFLTVVNYTIFAAIIKKKKKEEEVYLPM